MTANNNASSSFFGSLLGSLFGNNSGTNTFGVPLNQLKQAGQSEASSADANLSLQQKYADQAANSNYNTSLLAKLAGSNVDAQNYQAKTNIDTQAASDRQHNQINQASQAPGSSSFAGYQDGIYNYSPVIGGSPYSPTVSYRQQLSPQVALLREQNTLSQQDANSQLSRDSAMSDRSRYNQQILANTQYSNQSNLNAAQYANQRDLANIDAQSRVAAASIGAQGSVLGSLFGSFGNNGISGRYW